MTIKRTYKTRSVDPHNWDEEPDIEGVITVLDTLLVDDEERSFMTVDTGQALTQVFHSHALTEAFNEAAVGDHIHIQYRGKVKTKKGGHTFNRFAVQLWTEEVEDEEVQEAIEL